MKKSKFTLVIVLGLVLCLLCGMTTTFSWFNRPGSKSGDSLTYSDSYNVSNGKDITAVTYSASKPDGSEYSSDPFNFNSSFTVSSYETKYFCTEVKNSGNTPQSISLYLNNTDTNTLSVGVNSPLRSYRRYTADSEETYVTKTAWTVGKKNLYIATNVKDPTQYTMHAWKDGESDYVDQNLNSYISGKTGDYGGVKNYQISYVTIPEKYDRAQLWKGQESGNEWYGSGLEITETNNTYVFKDNKGTYMAQSGKAAGISSFYSEAEAVVGSKFDLSATAQGKVSYRSFNTAVAEVDSNGQVTAKSAGTATIRVTSTGIYGDTITADCTLTVGENPSQSSYLPIVTNMKVEGSTEGEPTVTKVYWYIKNDTTSDATYSLGNVQISL